MIDLAFGDSAAGALKFAKSMEPGELMNGATGVIGGTRKERREAMKPRYWAGVKMEGDCGNVVPLTLELDIGDISDMDISMDSRKRVLVQLFGDYENVSDGFDEQNQRTLARLRDADTTQEPIRMWVCASDPAELCGLYYVCHLMRNSQTPFSVVWVPQEVEKDSCLTFYNSTGQILPEDFGALVQYETPITTTQRRTYANWWCDLVQENAPLRAVINGRLMGVPVDFYDFALRANIPDGEFMVARLIGQSLTQMPGVGDRWLYLRLCEMLRTGELIEIAPTSDDYPYAAIMKRAR